MVYKEILHFWVKCYSQAPAMPSATGSQYLCFNNCIKIDIQVVCFREFLDKKINFLKDILDENGMIKTMRDVLRQHKINKWLL